MPSYETDHVTMEKAPVPVMPEDVASAVPAMPEDMACAAPPGLSYVDFLPRCLFAGSPTSLPLFDKFSSLAEGANSWLRANPHLRVVSCETVERKLDTRKQVIEMEKMTYHESAFGRNTYIRGLRLWVSSNATQEEAPQQLGYMDFLPEADVITVTSGATIVNKNGNLNQVLTPGHPMVENVWVHPLLGRGMMANMLGGAVDRHVQVYPIFEKLDSVVKRMNEAFAKNPLPGSILSLETVELKVAEAWSNDATDPERTSWVNNERHARLLLKMMRVFFLHGPPSSPVVGIQDFVPRVVKHVAGGRPVFEKVPEVLARANGWFTGNPDKQVTNQQLTESRVFASIFLQSFGDQGVTVDTETMHVEENMSFFPSSYVKVLRCPYVQQQGGAPPAYPLQLNCKIFVPSPTGGGAFESLSQTVLKIQQWLALNPGLPVMCCETLPHEYWRGSTSHVGKLDSMSGDRDADTGKYMLYTIRVYVNGPYRDPVTAKPTKARGSSFCSTM